MDYITRTIKSFDILSTKPSFLANKNDRFKTIYGGLMSLLIIILSIIAFGYFFSILFSYTQVTVVQNTSFSTSLNFTFSTNSRMIMFNALTTKHIPFPEQQRLFTITPININYTFVENSPGVLTQIFSSRILNATPCTLEILSPFKEYISNVQYENYYCLSPNQTVYFENTPDNQKYFYYFNIYYSPCQNSSANNYSCFDPSLLSSTLKNYNNEVIFLSTFFDHSNYTQPVQRYSNRIYDPSTSSLFNQKYFYQQAYNYRSDAGLMLDSTTNKTDLYLTSFNWVSVGISNSSFVPNSFFVNVFQMLPIISNYSRSYKKIQNVIAEIGGFINAILIASEIISSFISKKELRYKIFQKTVNLIDPQKVANKIEEKKRDKLEFSRNINNGIPSKIINNKNEHIILNINTNQLTTDRKTLNYDLISKRISRDEQPELNNFYRFDIISKIITENRMEINFFDYFLSTCRKNKIKSKQDAYYQFIDKKIMKWLDISQFIKMHNEIKYIKESLYQNEKKAMMVLCKSVFFRQKTIDDLDLNFYKMRTNHNENFKRVLDSITKKIEI